MTNIDLILKWALEVKICFKKSILCFREASEEMLKEKECLQNELIRFLKKASVKVGCLEKKLIECKNWPVIYHEGILIQSHLYRWKKGLKVLKVYDWELNQERDLILNPLLSGQEEIVLRFRKSKKLRLGVPHTEREIHKTSAFILTLNKLIAGIESLTDLAHLLAVRQILFPRLLKEERIVKKARSLPYREYWTASGHPIWVGKKAKDNETLSFHYAHGSDWWLHVQGFPGPHVILRGFKLSEPDPEALQDALQLALFYSQAKKAGYADIVITRQKYLSRFGKGKHSLGKVQMSTYKTLPVSLDAQRIEIIKTRNK